MTISMVDQNGKKKGEAELNPQVFEQKVNPDLMVQSVRVRLHNAWKGTRKTKGRSEVRGGGRKPWRQKGLGRARQGSIRSPLWVGGGHIHALRPSDHSLKMPRKMRRGALFSALSARANEDNVLVVDKISLKEAKTKKMHELMENLGVTAKTLIVLAEKDKNVELSARNISNIRVLEARLLSAFDVLSNEKIILTKDSLKVIEEVFLKDAN